MAEFKTSEHLLDNYQQHYSEPDPEWRKLGAQDKAANIMNLCADVPHARILEVGAGEGAILQRLGALSFGEALFGIEIVPNAVEQIQALDIPTLAEARQFDGYTIPYPDDHFDLVILSHVVEHLEYPRRLLYEAQRVAKFVYVEVPLEDNARLPLDFNFTSTGHINFYSYKTFRRLMQSANLAIVRQNVYNPAKAVLVYRYGRRGALQYALRQAALKLFPRLAQRIFTYHSDILCK